MDTCVQKKCALLPFSVSVLTLIISCVNGNECTLAITVERNTQYSTSVKGPLALECPVSFCSEELPNVTWCKVDGEQCRPMRNELRTSVEWTERKGNHAVNLLKFMSVEFNDSGSYSCKAKNLGSEFVGHAVQVNISAINIKLTSSIPTTNNTTPEESAPSLIPPTMSKLIYFAGFSFGACILIIIVSIVVYCLRRCKAKNGISQKTVTTDEVRYTADSEYPDNQLQIDAFTPSAYRTEPTAVSTNATYYNTLPCSQIRTTPNSPEEKDSIVYAHLNHKTNRPVSNKQQLAACQTEYVIVCSRNKSAGVRQST